MRKAIIASIATAVLLLSSCASTNTPSNSSAQPQTAPKAKNIAVGKDISSNGHIMDFVPANAVDGEILSYYEGPANAYPNELTVNLDRKVDLAQTKISLNPRRLWQERKQTIEIRASDDGQNFKTVVPATEYLFSPEDNQNSISVPLAVTAQYLRLVFTANTEATAGQVAEWEIFAK